MTILKILEYPDPRLRIKAEPVARVTPAVRQLAKDLLETMYAAPGAGLAATQVDQHIRLIVLDLSATGKEPQIFINPEILQREGRLWVTRVACPCRESRKRPRGRPAFRCGPRIWMTRCGSFGRRDCWPCASNTKWITWKENYSWTTSLN